MRITRLLLCISAFLAGLIEAQTDWVFDFSNKGYDFDQAIPPAGWIGVNRCGEPENQSPVNLMEPLGPYGWAYGEAVPFEHENLEVHYLDPKPGSKMFYERKNLKMAVNEFPEDAVDTFSFYRSDFAVDIYGCHTNLFEPTSFHFHHPTEHTVNGRHYDIAMHVPHYMEPDGYEGTDEFAAYALSVMFSIDEYDQDISQEEIFILQDFMESLKLDNRQTEDLGLGVQQMRFRDFMNVFDYNLKWMYIGSAGFPPCVKLIYWQVLEKRYPLEYKYMWYIRKIFLDHQDELKATTNIRGIHAVNGHKILYVGALSLRGAQVLAVVGTFAAALVLAS